MAKVNFSDKLKNWKNAYSIYVENDFTDEEYNFACRSLLLKGVELINEGIILDEKQAFRKNRDFLSYVKLLILEEPVLNPFQKDLIKKTIENYKTYAIIRVQGMK